MKREGEYSEKGSEKEPPCLQGNYKFYWKNRAYEYVIPCKTEWNVIQQSYKLNAMKEEKGD